MPTELSLQHLKENVEMYLAASQKQLCNEPGLVMSTVLIRHPDAEMQPAQIAVEGNKIGSKEYRKHLEALNNKTGDAILDILYD